jgi:hypothetical protein
MGSIRTIFFPIALAMGISACGGDDSRSTESAAADSVAREVLAKTGVEPASGAGPCEILSDGLIRAHFDIASEVEITRESYDYSPHPLCTVRWPKPNAAEIEAGTGEAMQEYMRKKMAGEDVKMPSFVTTDEVSLTLLKTVFDSGDVALASFDSAMKILSDGMTRKHKDVEVTFQADVTPVEGVGDKAMWAEKLHQLSVLSGRRIFHLGVKTGSDNDADTAKAMANAVIAAL